MRIVRYSSNDEIRYGSVETLDGGDVVMELSGNPILEDVTPTGVQQALSEVRLLAPVTPAKVIGLAKNYSPDRDPDLPAEGAKPMVFLKTNHSVLATGDPIVIPAISQDTGLEGELVVVIGKQCRHVAVEDVESVVYGYTVVNDVTARDYLTPDHPWGLAKGFDDFTPLGPWIVTGIPLAEASDLEITTRVDGKVVQQGTTRRLLWPIAQQVSFLSEVMTLFPGDVILAGTPAGAVRIEAGQTIEVEVERIGLLSNPVVDEVP